MSPVPIPKRCVDCDWRACTDVQNCPICGASLADAADVPVETQKSSSSTFSLSTMLLLMTVICIALGALRQFPVLGVMYLLALFPVLPLTMLRNRKRLALGMKTNLVTALTDFVYSFVLSVVAWAVVIAAIAAAIYAAYQGTFIFSDPTIDNIATRLAQIVASLIAVAAGLAILFAVLKRFVSWPTEKRSRTGLNDLVNSRAE